jgi:(p)ppGpp synthase/HD superfamily hydrolase
MINDFGSEVTNIVDDVTKNPNISDWYEVSDDYINHLLYSASDEAIIVSASDKIHNLSSTIIDYKQKGDELWQIFKTKNRDDQVWFYSSVLKAVNDRKAPLQLIDKFKSNLDELIKITT